MSSCHLENRGERYNCNSFHVTALNGVRKRITFVGVWRQRVGMSNGRSCRTTLAGISVTRATQPFRLSAVTNYYCAHFDPVMPMRRLRQRDRNHFIVGIGSLLCRIAFLENLRVLSISATCVLLHPTRCFSAETYRLLHKRLQISYLSFETSAQVTIFTSFFSYFCINFSSSRNVSAWKNAYMTFA